MKAALCNFCGKALIVICLSLPYIPLRAQSPVYQGKEPTYTTYLDAAFAECKKKDALFVRYLYTVNDSLLIAHVNDVSGIRKMDGHFLLRKEMLLEHGHFVFYHPGGKVESQGLYEYGYKTGAWERYATDGTRKPDRYYNPESGNILRALQNEP